MTDRKVLCITLEPISAQMAGPAIRCLEIAKQLASDCCVWLFSPHATDLTLESGVKLMSGISKHELYKLAEKCDILFIQANVLKPYPELSKMGKYLIVDLYDPYILSLLAQYADSPSSASSSYRLMHKVLEKHMLAADFSVCASERQRDYWIGRYCALGRLTPEFHRFDPTFRKLIDIVPFGLPATPPCRTGPSMRGTVPGITSTDKILLWGGGIWEWFDPLTIIRAVSRLAPIHPNLKLFFMGWKSPNPQVPLMGMAIKARQLAKDLNLLNQHVFFHDSWIPYEDRANYLLDADIAVTAHFDLPETHFSFRTRILDFLWAGLPIITTSGDNLSDLIEKGNAGLSLPYGDIDAWVSAISRLLHDSSLCQTFKEGALALSHRFHWESTTAPLREYCRNPYHLPRYSPVTMPSIFERAKAVYARGGTDMVMRRSRDLIHDIFRM